MVGKPWPFEPVVRAVVTQLAAGQYADLEHRTGGVRLTAGQIADAVREYGRRILPPSDADLPLDVVPITAAAPRAWSVNVPLSTTDEGRSDLTLQLTIRAAQAGGYHVEIDDLHVL